MSYRPLLVVLSSSALALLGLSCQLPDKVQSGLDTINETKNVIQNRQDHHTVIVAGYGTPVKGNAKYEQYIKSVADYVNFAENGVDSVVFAGSYTDDPNLSEAEAMNSFFNSQVDTGELQTRGVKVYKEECSIMSWQNISYTQELLAEKDIRPTLVTLFGDVNRGDKLQTFAAYQFNLGEGLPDNATELINSAVNVANVQFKGFDFDDAVDSQDERNAKFAAEIAGAYDVKLGNELLGKRLGDWTATFGFDVSDNLVKKGCTQYSGF
jgi:hypothetical protein